jgi:hypothetical protein
MVRKFQVSVEHKQQWHSSCEAELYAAYAAIAEGLFLVRVCKFLCGDQLDENNGEVRVKLHIDSSAAMGYGNNPESRIWSEETHPDPTPISSRFTADEKNQFAQSQYKDESSGFGNKEVRSRETQRFGQTHWHFHW